MGFRFRKRIKIFPGVYINLSNQTLKSFDSSVTVGRGGLGANISKKGVRGFVGAPGTGLSYRDIKVPLSKRLAKWTIYIAILGVLYAIVS